MALAGWLTQDFDDIDSPLVGDWFGVNVWESDLFFDDYVDDFQVAFVDGVEAYKAGEAYTASGLGTASNTMQLTFTPQ